MKIVKSSGNEFEEEGDNLNLIPLRKDYPREAPRKIMIEIEKKAQKGQKKPKGKKK